MNWNTAESGTAMRVMLVMGAALALVGCKPQQTAEKSDEPQVTTNKVIIATNSPQLNALTVEVASNAKKGVVPLSGRLIWDEDVTVRVFSPFAGIVRKLGVNVGQSVTKGTPLADLQSGDYAQVRAEARKAGSDFRRAERTLNRLRELAEHGAAPKKDLESAEADHASAEAEKERAAGR